MLPVLAGQTNKLVTVLQQNPTAFHSVAGCILFAGSDALAQSLEQKPLQSQQTSSTTIKNPHFTHPHEFRLEIRRFLSAGLLGILFCGFLYPLAYVKLDAWCKGTSLVATFKKSLVEIVTVGIFANTVSMILRGLLAVTPPGERIRRAQKTKRVISHVMREMPNVTMNDARIWLPYNLVAFTWIPIGVRPVTTSLMEVVWQTYISLCAHKKDRKRKGA